jgi:hypothetical protein|tara:strand:+ start:4123 stop:4755 length:633 start_codon:yes stop_codon:yes gene_type:complete
MMQTLIEKMSPSQAALVAERDNEGKDLYMKGIFIQGEKQNHNGRVYPLTEISKAVKTLQEKIEGGYSVLGEADHPDDLNINLDRVSHVIENIQMNGSDGIGKLKLLPTPMGNICTTLIESGVKLGVSSRGSGNVTESGKVSDFEIVTVDIVANPSAPEAYPDPIYEQLMNHGRKGNVLMDVARATEHDKKAQKYLKEEILRFINDLGYRR